MKEKRRYFLAPWYVWVCVLYAGCGCGCDCVCVYGRVLVRVYVCVCERESKYTYKYDESRLCLIRSALKQQKEEKGSFCVLLCVR